MKAGDIVQLPDGHFAVFVNQLTETAKVTRVKEDGTEFPAFPLIVDLVPLALPFFDRILKFFNSEERQKRVKIRREWREYRRNKKRAYKLEKLAAKAAAKKTKL